MQEIARKARKASQSLQQLSEDHKNRILKSIQQSLRVNQKLIVAANSKDKEIAQNMVAKGQLSQTLFKRLDIEGEEGKKWNDLLQGIGSVIDLKDPTNTVTLARELAEGLSLYRVSCPIGVLLVIFEARPEVAF